MQLWNVKDISLNFKLSYPNNKYVSILVEKVLCSKKDEVWQ